jgi:predicted transposase YdaD
VGLAQGREVEREEIARNALEEGVSDETIQKITGLSLDEIRRLKN